MAFRRSGKRQKIDAERAADPSAALSVATTLLRARDHGAGELESKLRERGFEAEAATGAVTELGELGLLNDPRYAESFVRLHADRGQGPVRIRGELNRRGLPAELIETALAAVPSWHAVARAVRARKFGSAAPTSWPEKARQSRFLQYRGFSSDHIGSALGSDFDPDTQLEDT